MTTALNSTLELSLGQVEAKEKIIEWYERVSKYEVERAAHPVFKLHGYAGTGKTTTIKQIIHELGCSAAYMAYTGKAALVMQRQGLNATTIHSAIYIPVPPDKPKCNELFKQIKETSNPAEKKRLQTELRDAQQFTFNLKTPEESVLGEVDLCVIDECSMVDEEMKRDLLTFGVPLLALGDPGQLPPIKGTGALVDPPPDHLLTEIHRQAEGNPIIDYATRARNGVFIPYGERETSARLKRNEANKALVFGCDQILTGKNASRRDINMRYRELKGRMDRYPEPGEKLICLRNNVGCGILNGMMCEVVERLDEYDAGIEYKLQLETGAPITCQILRAHFDAYHDKEALNNVKWWERKDTEEFDFGYAITVHKSQGSQWDRVLVFDDKFLTWAKTDRRRWLYTAITRAAESVVIADY